MSIIISADVWRDGAWTGESIYLESSDLGKTWEKNPYTIPTSLGLVGEELVRSPARHSVLYKSVDGLGLYVRSDDGGLNWQLPAYFIEGKTKEEFVKGIVGDEFHRLEVWLVGSHPHRAGTIYASFRITPWAVSLSRDPKVPPYPVRELPGVYVSHDGGDSWEKFSDRLRAFSPLAHAPSNPNTVYADSENGPVKSTDGGKTWNAVGQQRELLQRPLYAAERDYGLNLTGAPARLEVRQIVVDPRDENLLYVVTNKGVYRSETGGKNWCLLDFGFDRVNSYYSIVLNPLNPDEIFVGTHRGTFHSKDRGCTMEKIWPVQWQLDAASRKSAVQRQGQVTE